MIAARARGWSFNDRNFWIILSLLLSLRGLTSWQTFLVIEDVSLTLERFHYESVEVVPSQRVNNIRSLKALYGRKKLLFTLRYWRCWTGGLLS